MNPENPAASQCEMELLAHRSIIAVFARLMRIRLATQEGYQRLMTLSILQSEFDDALRRHESQVLVNGVLEQRGILYRDSFCRLQGALMREVGQGLTPAEQAALIG